MIQKRRVFRAQGKALRKRLVLVLPYFPRLLISLRFWALWILFVSFPVTSAECLKMISLYFMPTVLVVSIQNSNSEYLFMPEMGVFILSRLLTLLPSLLFPSLLLSSPPTSPPLAWLERISKTSLILERKGIKNKGFFFYG